MVASTHLLDSVPRILPFTKNILTLSVPCRPSNRYEIAARGCNRFWAARQSSPCVLYRATIRVQFAPFSNAEGHLEDVRATGSLP